LRSSSKDIESLSDPAWGEINIGSLPALTGAILPRLIERFGQQYPRAVLNIDDVDTLATQLARLRDRKYDLTLSRLPRSPLKEDDLNVEVLYEDGIVLAAGMHSRWARRRKIDLAELVDEPWLLSVPHGWPNAYVAEVFQARGLELPKASVMTSSVSLRAYLLATGRYITAFPRSALGLHAKRYGLKELPVDLPNQPWPVLIVTLKHRTLSPVVERFIECAREVAKLLGKG
jgi:DNA-binding transcriptional LysR family regulator